MGGLLPAGRESDGRKSDIRSNLADGKHGTPSLRLQLTVVAKTPFHDETWFGQSVEPAGSCVTGG
jgi:hypothetical protein